jgi:hypothetical protein
MAMRDPPAPAAERSPADAATMGMAVSVKTRPDILDEEKA